MIVRIAIRVGEGHTLSACRTPAELAQALRNLADEIDAMPAWLPDWHDSLWPRIVRNAEGGWAGPAWLSAEGADAAPGAGPEVAP
jgi:hypothetical protein